ncbi:MAG: hypothetical protein A2X13_06040 [Bacteroidetes bacterium GWC2_33_15]|nr:MAG: hypothetical protein A2X10_03720 [Bacteroidetes bacterium GWA2_33_15]OFX51784.1 MAG: hypothetical protein A2X13_06040 [Bacteroidetes bacterium GWC2_33_15]HAN17193.1 hypothetical protein [Bacteroidales bacterium]
MMYKNNDFKVNGVIYLVQLPFWTPLIPPQGIAKIKSYLQSNGYRVKTSDLNVDYEVKSTYESLLKIIRDIVPKEKWGNFYDNIHEIIKYSLLLVLNEPDYEKAHPILKKIFNYYYLVELTKEDSARIISLLTEYFTYLENSIVSQILNDEEISVLGLSLHSGNLGSGLYVLKRIKQEKPYIKTVIGGSIFMGELRNNTPDFNRFYNKADKLIDYYIIGSGESSFLHLLKNRFSSTERVIISDPAKEAVLGFGIKPDLDDFDIKKYPYIASYVSQSCPNKCSFCNERTFMGEYIERDINRVVDEIEHNSKLYQKNMIFMLDVLMNNYITQFSKGLIQRGLNIFFDGYIRVSDQLNNSDQTQLWREAGFYRARLGIESGSQKILDLINKNITVEQIYNSLKGLAGKGIKTTTYLVIGHPGETDNDFKETLDLLTRSQEYIWQAEPHLFRYFYTGQSDSETWAKSRIPLYTDEELDILFFQTYNLDLLPTRTTSLERIWRMMEHIEMKGIVNPFSVYDKFKADERWSGLHENSVPSVVEMDEISKVTYGSNKMKDTVSTRLEFEDNFLF